MSAPRVLELFAGCGGASLGLRSAGFGHVACVERDAAAASTLATAGLPVLHADVRDVDYTVFRDVDAVWASPPCQPGSTAGKRRGSADVRDGWPWTLDALDVVQPRWFMAENVLGWTFHTQACPVRQRPTPGCVGCSWEHVVVPEIRRRFAFVSTWRLNAADYGVPQHRRRVIVVAGPVPTTPPPPTHGDPSNEDTGARGLRPWVSLAESIGDTLLDPATCNERACYPCDGSHGRACAERWRIDQPAPTVTTTEVKGTRAHAPEWSFHGGPDRASDTAFLVAGVRRIEVAEGLALQGFPPGWPVQGTRKEQYRQVGNAVPPALAAAVGRVVGERQRAVDRLVGDGVDLNELAGALRRRRAAA